MCSFCKSFHISGKANNSKAFKVKRRAALGTRNIGVGHQGLVKFACVINMLPPINENAYQDHVQAVHDVAECIAKESMSQAANRVKEFYEPDEERISTLQCREMEPGEKENSLHLIVLLQCCPLSLKKLWTMKSCQRSVLSAN